ncbi:MAG: hypothetical protein WCJ88_00845 [Actinomycetes bacterium]
MCTSEHHGVSRQFKARLSAAIAVLAVVVFGVFAATIPASAQASQSWSVTPAGGSPDQPGSRTDLSYTVDPGTLITDTIQVWNYGSEPIQLKVYAADALITSEGSYDLRPSGEVSTDVAAWTVLSSNTVTIAPSSVTAVNVSIAVPKDALPGDHPGGIVASVATPTTNADGAQVVVEKRVGTRLNVRVNGDIVPSAAIKSVSASYSGSLNPIAPGSVNVKYIFVNTGNTRLAGTMRLELSGIGGSKSIDMPEVTTTMPGNTLEQSFTVADVWPTGMISAKVIFTPKDDPGIPELQSIASATGSGSTIAIPFGQLLSLMVIVGLIVLYRRRRQAKIDRLVAAATATPRTPPTPPTEDREPEPVG